MKDKCPKCDVEADVLMGTIWCTEVHGYHMPDGQECLLNRLGTLQEIIDKLPTCWRLVDGKLVQDVPITPDNFECWSIEDNEAGPGKVVASVTVLALLGNCAVRCNIEGYRKLTGVVRAARELFTTKAAAEAATAKDEEPADG